MLHRRRGRLPNPVTAPVFMLMWLTMMVAMMFPTIAPMVLAHRLVVLHRGDGVWPSVTFVLGYLVVWTAIGFVPLAVFLDIFKGGRERFKDAWPWIQKTRLWWVKLTRPSKGFIITKVGPRGVTRLRYDFASEQLDRQRMV